MWSLTNDHTHCILKIGINKPANESSRFGYIQLQPRFAWAKREPHIPIGPSESRTFQSWNALVLSHIWPHTHFGYFSYYDWL
jgi:hypothetical protein